MLDSDSRDICEFLDWDSEFFGMRIGRYKETRIDASTAERVIDWCRCRRIACLYLLADSTDPVTVRVAEDLRFRLVDVRVTFSTSLLPGRPIGSPSPISVRRAEEKDIPALAKLARVSHRATRFHFDSMFPERRSDELYATWIERSFHGLADAVLVGDAAGELCAYVTCHFGESGTGSIGLLAVDENQRGRGYGRSLISAALEIMRDKGMVSATVVTQGRNIASQRLYEECGFKVAEQQLWYHRWFAPGDETKKL